MIPPVSIVILCHNDQACLKDCAASLNRHTPRGSCELILVDNGSRPEARPALSEIKRRSAFPAKIIRNYENRFFGPANNQGLAASRSPYVLFLNADTIVTPGWLPALLDGLRSDQRLGMTGPMTNSAVGFQVVNDACAQPRQLRRWFPAWKKGRSPGVRRVPWIIGFCVLMPRPLAAKVIALAFQDCDNLPNPGLWRHSRQQYQPWFQPDQLPRRLAKSRHTLGRQTSRQKY